jgi:hypothetical protein
VRARALAPPLICRAASQRSAADAHAAQLPEREADAADADAAAAPHTHAPRRAASWPFAANGAADAHARAFSAPPPPPLRYDTVRIFVLTAAWSAPRAANAARICAGAAEANADAAAARMSNASSDADADALQPRLREVSCRVVSALRGEAVTPEAAARAQAAGLVSLAPTPAAPPLLRALLLPLLPRALAPLLPEYPLNQLTPPNWRWRGALANTLGALACLREMAAAADADDAEFLRLQRHAGANDAASEVMLPSTRTLYVYLEDDADLGAAPERFPAALLAASSALPAAWDVMQLSPPAGLCARAARLPPPWRVPPGGLLTPRLALSRTTGVAFSAAGVASLLARLPATNTIDLWLRALMRARTLAVRVSCARLVDFHATSATQA